MKIVFEPGEPGSGYSFESKVVGGSIPKEFIPGVEKGLAASRETGVLAFEIAARAAFREGPAKAQCKLLESIMKVEVVTPEDRSDCIDDLNTRRGKIKGIETRGDAQVINALMPLANMFGYGNTLRALTQRRGTFGMVFDHYAPIPGPDDEPFRPAVGMRA